MLASTVFQNRSLAGCSDDAFGQQFDFPSGSRCVHGEVWYRHPAEASTEMSHDVNAGVKGCSQMLDSLNQIALEKIIGADSVVEKRAAEFLDDLRGVVDSAEEHGLVPHGNSSLGEAVRRSNGHRSQLDRMVEVGVDEQGSMPAEHGDQFGCDAHRQIDQCARGDSDDPNRFDRTDPREHIVQLAVRQHERVAAGEEHVVHLGVASKVLCARHDLLG